MEELMARLDVYTDFKLQTSFKMESDKTVIGRDPRCAVQIPDGKVSRMHAVIYEDSCGHEIENLGTNGTKVNGNFIQESRPLMPGDVIAVSSYLLVYQSDETPPESIDATILD
jgi:pSer/pThr/pTyr-binding forkhead associated (FHA) protein